LRLTGIPANEQLLRCRLGRRTWYPNLVLDRMNQIVRNAIAEQNSGPCRPDPSQSNVLPNCSMSTPAPIMSATPRKAIWVPRVAISVGMPVLETMVPFDDAAQSAGSQTGKNGDRDRHACLSSWPTTTDARA